MYNHIEETLTRDELLQDLCYGCDGSGDECRPDSPNCLRRIEFKEYNDRLIELQEIHEELTALFARPARVSSW